MIYLSDKRRRHCSKKGFTLIELMVVIAIMSLLASMVLGQLSIARRKGRDSKRLQEVRGLVTALEQERQKYGHFPCHYLQVDSDQSDSSANPNFMKKFVDDGVLPTIPHDPTRGYYVYEYATVKNHADPTHSTQCGEIAFLGVYFEDPSFTCPSFGFGAADSVDPSTGTSNHCHIWYPNPPPCPSWLPQQGPGGNIDPGKLCADYGDWGPQTTPYFTYHEDEF